MSMVTFSPRSIVVMTRSGMGLRIGVSILEALGGRLWMQPNAGPGVTFSCAIPTEAATNSGLRSIQRRHNLVVGNIRES